MTAAQQVAASRTALVLDQPFFGALSLRLKVTEDATCDTAWTDGQSIGYNPQYVETLSSPQLLGLLCHEVLHVANGHPWRRGNRDPVRWNRACDYVINNILIACGFTLPEGALIDPQYAGKSAEYVYSRLLDEDQQQDQQDQQDQQGEQGEPQPAGEVRDAPEDADTETEWQQAVQQAATAAKGRGALPGDLRRQVEQILQPRVDWQSVLRRFVSETCHSDYNWTRPSARHCAAGLYLPSLHSETVGPLAVVVDTSGSIDAVTLSQMVAEVQAIADEVEPARVHVLSCDSRVRSIETFEQGEPITANLTGGGGTAFQPAFDAIADLPEQAAAVIYLTDLYGPDAIEPDVPVLWACTSDMVAPWGETVRVDI